MSKGKVHCGITQAWKAKRYFGYKENRHMPIRQVIRSGGYATFFRGVKAYFNVRYKASFTIPYLTVNTKGWPRLPSGETYTHDGIDVWEVIRENLTGKVRIEIFGSETIYYQNGETVTQSPRTLTLSFTDPNCAMIMKMILY